MKEPHVIVFGCGKMGTAIVLELLRCTNFTILIYDTQQTSLRQLSKKISVDQKARLYYSTKIPTVCETTQTVILAIPWLATMQFLQQWIALPSTLRKIPVLSITRPPYDQIQQLEEMADKHHCCWILPVGLEPGLIEIIMGWLAKNIPELSVIKAYCGGITDKPVPPLNYHLSFGTELPTTQRDTWYIHRGVIFATQRFMGLEQIYIPNIGVLEAHHDGMMPVTVNSSWAKQLTVLEQKTLRWPGFVDCINNLRCLGLLSDEKVSLGTASYSKKYLTNRMLQQLFTPSEGRHEQTIIRLDVSDVNNKQGCLTLIIPTIDKEPSLASVTAVVVAQLTRYVIGQTALGLKYPCDPWLIDSFLGIFRRLIGSGAYVSATGILAEYPAISDLVT